MNVEKLRKQKSECIYKPRAILSLVAKKNCTTHLPRGTAGRFVEFAVKCAENDLPLNTLLSLRWHALLAEGADYAYLSLPTRERISKTVELIRHFLAYRGVKFVWIWVQEMRTDSKGLHWHLAFHCPPHILDELLDYVEHHFGLTRLPKHLVLSPSEGEIGRSEANAWHLGVDTRNEFDGLGLALYLGKGEGEGVDREALFALIKQKSAFPNICNFESFANSRINKHYGHSQGEIDGQNKDRFAISRARF